MLFSGGQTAPEVGIPMSVSDGPLCRFSILTLWRRYIIPFYTAHIRDDNVFYWFFILVKLFETSYYPMSRF